LNRFYDKLFTGQPSDWYPRARYIISTIFPEAISTRDYLAAYQYLDFPQLSLDTRWNPDALIRFLDSEDFYWEADSQQYLPPFSAPFRFHHHRQFAYQRDRFLPLPPPNYTPYPGDPLDFPLSLMDQLAVSVIPDPGTAGIPPATALGTTDPGSVLPAPGTALLVTAMDHNAGAAGLAADSPAGALPSLLLPSAGNDSAPLGPAPGSNPLSLGIPPGGPVDKAAPAVRKKRGASSSAARMPTRRSLDRTASSSEPPPPPPAVSALATALVGSLARGNPGTTLPGLSAQDQVDESDYIFTTYGPEEQEADRLQFLARQKEQEDSRRAEEVQDQEDRRLAQAHKDKEERQRKEQARANAQLAAQRTAEAIAKATQAGRDAGRREAEERHSRLQKEQEDLRARSARDKEDQRLRATEALRRQAQKDEDLRFERILRERKRDNEQLRSSLKGKHYYQPMDGPDLSRGLDRDHNGDWERYAMRNSSRFDSLGRQHVGADGRGGERTPDGGLAEAARKAAADATQAQLDASAASARAEQAALFAAECASAAHQRDVDLGRSRPAGGQHVVDAQRETDRPPAGQQAGQSGLVALPGQRDDPELAGRMDLEDWLHGLGAYVLTSVPFDTLRDWFVNGNYHVMFPVALQWMEWEDLPVQDWGRGPSRAIWAAIQLLRAAAPAGGRHRTDEEDRPPGNHGPRGGGGGGGSDRSTSGGTRGPTSISGGGRGGTTQGGAQHHAGVWDATRGPAGGTFPSSAIHSLDRLELPADTDDWTTTREEGQRNNTDHTRSTGQYGHSPTATEPALGTYRVTDLDGRNFSCTNKQAGHARMQTLQGMVRAMGMDRFLTLVQDLDFSIPTFFAAADRFMSQRMAVPATHPLASMAGYQAISEAMVLRDRTATEKALKLEFDGYDLDSLSLQSFIIPPSGSDWDKRDSWLVWTRAATSQGRRDMAAAVSNLEAFFTAFHHPGFAGSLAPITDALTKGVRHRQLTGYHDVYIWLEIQRMLKEWSLDVRKFVTPVNHAHMDMTTPARVAELLWTYAMELVRAADQDSRLPAERRWEPQPHSDFYSEMGAYRRYMGNGPKTLTNPPPTVSWNEDGFTLEGPKPPKRGEDKPKRPRTGKEAQDGDRTAATDAQICPFHLKELLGIKKLGTLVVCTAKPCKKTHPGSLGAVTLAEATKVASSSWNSEDRKILAAGTWTWKAA